MAGRKKKTSEEDNAKLPSGDIWRNKANPKASALFDLEIPLDINDLIKKAAENARKHNEDLHKLAKPYEALIVPVEAIVESVEGYTTTVYARSGPLIIGGHNPTYRSGHISRLELYVKTTEPTPITKITFNGLPPIYAGDKILAYVFKGREEYEKESIGYFCRPRHLAGPGLQPEPFYVEREFNKEEQIEKIEKLSNGKVIATYSYKE